MIKGQTVTGIITAILLSALLASCASQETEPEYKPPEDKPVETGAPRDPAGSTENLFSLYADKTEEETEEKVKTAVDRFFGIGTGEPNLPVAGTGYRCYFELPQDDSMAFIWAADSNDIRSEGMSYGMMIAVQMDMKEEFDKLWKFAAAYMQYDPEDLSNPPGWKNYFRWQLTQIDTDNPDEWRWNPQYYATPAPDGEVYFAMALYLADKRWGSDGAVNYKKEADTITNAMLNNTPSSINYPIIHQEKDIITFVPFGDSYSFTDPSYHLPSFFESFAAWGPEGNAERWMRIAAISRNFLVKSAHPETGLHPDYAHFDGTPVKNTSGDTGDGLSGNEHDTFRYDAWRVPMNMAMDAAWYGNDERMKEQVEKYHNFFSGHKGMYRTANSLFTLDGKTGTGGGSTALTATLAAGSMVSSHPDAGFWVEALWNIGQQSGRYRYYQQCVYLLGMLNTAGMYRTDWNQ